MSFSKLYKVNQNKYIQIIIVINYLLNIFILFMKDRNDQDHQPNQFTVQQLKICSFNTLFSYSSQIQTLGDQSAANYDYKNAIKMYTMALQIEKYDEEIWHNRSLVYYKIQKYYESLSDAIEAVKLNCKYLKAYIRATQACLQLNKLQQSKQFIQKIEQIDHQNEDLRKLKKRVQFIKNIEEKTSFNKQRDQFMSWLKDKNSIFDKVTIYLEDNGNRSVRAKQRIAKKQIFLFIPKEQLITLQMTKYNKTVIKILEKKLELISPKHCLLSIYLLQLKKAPNSKFQKYIKLLPKTYQNFPIFYTENQLQQLKGSYFLQQIRQKIIDIKKDYEQIINLDPQNFKFTFEQFCWARMTVCSRVFGISIHDIKTDVLVPLADMLNHHALKQTIWYYSDQREGFVIQSLEQIELGVQIFDSYGKKCNSRFLLNYGFILQSNDCNQVTIKVELDQNQQNFEKKIELVGDQNFLFSFRITKNIQDKRFNQLLQTCRFLVVSSPNELKLLNNVTSETMNFKPSKTAFISFQNEKKCWAKLYDIFHKHLKVFPTTQQQDEKLLQNPTLSFNRKNCIFLRKGQKQILNYFLRICQKMKYIFTVPKKSIKKFVLQPEFKELIIFIIPLATAFK